MLYEAAIATEIVGFKFEEEERFMIWAAIRRKALVYGLKFNDPKGDGNCFFSALAITKAALSSFPFKIF